MRNNLYETQRDIFEIFQKCAFAFHEEFPFFHMFREKTTTTIVSIVSIFYSQTDHFFFSL